jgi:peptide/nickel transport system substrate-binding protein
MNDRPDRQEERESERGGMPRRELLRRAGVSAVSVASAGSLLAACGGGGSGGGTPTTAPTSKPRRGGTLRIGMTGGSNADTLDPYTQLSLVDTARDLQLHDSLTVIDREARTQLSLAEEITPNKAGTEWTIRLKPDLEFHNGQPVTSDDVMYVFQRIANPKRPGNAAPLITQVDVKRLKKLDKRTLLVPCTTPYATLPETLGNYQQFVVVPRGYDARKPIGCGPFKFKSFRPGVDSVFERNENYWQSGIPYIDELTITNFADEQAQVNALLSGQLDGISSLSSDSVSAIRARGGGFKMYTSNSGGWNPFVMRCDTPPFDDVRVRQAFRLIVDREQMLKVVFGDGGIVGNDIVSIWDPVYDHQIPQRKRDIDQAKALLAQAGHGRGLTVELVTSDISQGVVKSAQVFAQQAKAAGVDVRVRKVTTTELFGPNYLKWPFTQDYWYYNPYFSQVALATGPGSPYNTTHFKDAEYESLYAKGLSELDEKKRADIAHQMMQIEYERGGYIIPYFTPVIDAVTSTVQGVKTSKPGTPFNQFDFKHMWRS